MTSPWTDDRIALVKREWAAGLSGSEIAKQLGVTRNAVIGKVYRLGLGGTREKPCRPQLGSQAQRRKAASRDRHGIARPRKQKNKPMPPKPPEPCAPLNISITDIGSFECRAVVDNSEWGRAKMCGNKCAPNSVYCPGHDAMFYTLQDRKRA